MKEKRNGFTLIELLAVIVILAIIALIAVPVIMNIISKANKSAFKDSAYGIIKAGELYYSEKLLEVDGMTSTKTFEFPDAVGLDLKGSRPTSGTMKVSKDGKVTMAISNGKYCIRKGYNDTDVTIDENIEDCILPKEELENQNPNISSSNNCIKYDEACENGTKVNVKVNNTENHDFYVIKDTGTELTLIMDRNLGSKVAWITKEDYIAAGGTEADYGSRGNTNKGPLTVINALEMRTAGWTNIEAYNYTYTDDGGENKYSSITRNNIRARLLTNTEATGLGCKFYQSDGSATNSCSTYLYKNTSSSNTEEAHAGYWLSSANSSISYYGLNVNHLGYVVGSNVCLESHYGVRPVIKISKTI